jgi:hypothetical protein
VWTDAPKFSTMADPSRGQFEPINCADELFVAVTLPCQELGQHHKYFISLFPHINCLFLVPKQRNLAHTNPNVYE